MIESLLDHAGWTMEMIDYIAVSAGPGSYTGLRIGASTAKGLCFAAGVPLVAVPTLEALALQARPTASEGDLIVATLDARRGNVYGAAFQICSDEVMAVVVEQTVMDAVEFVASLPETGGDVWLIGDGSPRLEPELDGVGVLRLDNQPSAITVAEVAEQHWLTGKTVDVTSFEPNYLREFVAERPKGNAFEKLPF